MIPFMLMFRQTLSAEVDGRPSIAGHGLCTRARRRANEVMQTGAENDVTHGKKRIKNPLLTKSQQQLRQEAVLRSLASDLL
jgi:hypothetical protein